ncbi:hypothetical protein QYF36_012125 [Acer negundo]|nr:hypothetical protein QYF36_012125 [Acer negundo]
MIKVMGMVQQMLNMEFHPLKSFVDLLGKVSMMEDGEGSSPLNSAFRRGRRIFLAPIRHSMKTRSSIVLDKIPWNSEEEIVKGLESKEWYWHHGRLPLSEALLLSVVFTV